MRILYNSKLSQFKTPFGTLCPGETCTMHIQIPCSCQTVHVEVRLLREDGNVEFVMAGANIPSLTWSYGKVPTDSGEADGIVIAYPGQLLYLVPTEQGFDMDYFGTMLMHFAPEA